MNQNNRKRSRELGEKDKPENQPEQKKGNKSLYSELQQRLVSVLITDLISLIFEYASTIGPSWLRQWGSRGKNDGQMEHPTGIALANNELFVTDLNWIQVFHSITGRFLRKWSSSKFPNSVTIDGQEVFVTIKTGRIDVYNLFGTQLIRKLEKPFLYNLRDLYIEDNEVYLVYDGDTPDGDMSVMTKQFEFVRNLNIQRGSKICIDGQELFVSDKEFNLIVVYDKKTGQYKNKKYGQHHVTGSKYLESPFGVCVHGNDLIVCDSTGLIIFDLNNPFYPNRRFHDSTRKMLLHGCVVDTKRSELFVSDVYSHCIHVFA